MRPKTDSHSLISAMPAQDRIIARNHAITDLVVSTCLYVRSVIFTHNGSQLELMLQVKSYLTNSNISVGPMRLFTQA